MDNIESGYKGACHCCEPVALLNVKLEKQLEIAEEYIRDDSCLMSGYSHSKHCGKCNTLAKINELRGE